MPATGHHVKQVNLQSYKKNKIKMLKKDFLIDLTKEERDAINRQDNEIAIDRCCRTILLNHL